MFDLRSGHNHRHYILSAGQFVGMLNRLVRALDETHNLKNSHAHPVSLNSFTLKKK